MKNLLVIFCFVLSVASVKGQNLVPNPSFEDTVACPIYADQVDHALYWYQCRGTPDYYNYCSNVLGPYVGVPNNWCGFQYPHSGDAFAGMIPYDVTSAPYREYIGVPLLSPTIIGQKYFATLWVSWNGTIGFGLGINKLGITLSTVQYSTANPYPITNNPIAYSDSIYTDSVGWGKIRLSFIADSSYQYLMLGNFFDDALTDTVHLGVWSQHAYYYIDDVCLSTDSLNCEGSNENISENKLQKGAIIDKCFYSDNTIHIDFIPSLKEKNIFLYSITGGLIFNGDTKQNKYDIPITQANTIYFIKIISNNKQESKKIITIKN